MASNMLVMQSGGSTQVLNRTLKGLVVAAEEYGFYGKIYGSVHGLDGILSGKLVELSNMSETRWNRIARTPGALLKSSRRKLHDGDVDQLFKILEKYGIRNLFIVGGNDSAETGHRINEEARNSGYLLSVIHVPKTIDNDLVLTDHSPGYGSAARFVALAVMGVGRDAETMGKESPITILEVMGRDSGWLAASSALAKNDPKDAPHLICVPEMPIDEQTFLGEIESSYVKYGFVVAVVAENTRGTSGVLGSSERPWYVDDFGHAYYEGAGGHLASLVGKFLKIRVRYERPGTIQRSMISCVSTTDAVEAEMVGRAAIDYCVEGVTDKTVTLIRDSGEQYACSTGLASLRNVAGKVRKMPEYYLEKSTYSVTDSFVRYSLPLIGSALPKLERII